MRCLHYLTSNHLCLAITAPAVVCDWLVAFWQRSFYLQSAPAALEPRLRYHFLPDPHAVPAEVPCGQPVYHSRDLVVWQTQAGFRLSCSDSLLQVYPATGEAVGWLAPAFPACPLHEQRDFFLLSLLMLCHGRHCFAIHANGLCDPEGRAYLLVGNSGSGKTTLAMTCVQQGWHYLGDDVVLLGQSGLDIHAYALRRDFACSQRTLAHLWAQDSSNRPGMTAVGDEAIPDAKQMIDEAGFYPARVLPTLRPTMICFTHIVQQPQSQLSPLAQSQALIYLAQQSAGLMTDRTIAQRQLTLLKQLTTQAPGYTLALGQDVFRDPGALPRLLQQEPHGG